MYSSAFTGNCLVAANSQQPTITSQQTIDLVIHHSAFRIQFQGQTQLVALANSLIYFNLLYCVTSLACRHAAAENSSQQGSTSEAGGVLWQTEEGLLWLGTLCYLWNRDS